MGEILSRHGKAEVAIVVQDVGTMELLAVLSDKQEIHRFPGDAIDLGLGDWLSVIVQTVLQPWRLHQLVDFSVVPETPIDAALNALFPAEFRDPSAWMPLPGNHMLRTHEDVWAALNERFEALGGLRAAADEGDLLGALVRGKFARLRVGPSVVTYDARKAMFHIVGTKAWTPCDLIAHFALLTSDLQVSEQFPASYAPFSVLSVRDRDTVVPLDPEEKIQRHEPDHPAGDESTATEALTAVAPPLPSPVLDAVVAAGETAVPDPDEITLGVPELRALKDAALRLDRQE